MPLISLKLVGPSYFFTTPRAISLINIRKYRIFGNKHTHRYHHKVRDYRQTIFWHQVVIGVTLLVLKISKTSHQSVVNLGIRWCHPIAVAICWVTNRSTRVRTSHSRGRCCLWWVGIWRAVVSIHSRCRPIINIRRNPSRVLRVWRWPDKCRSRRKWWYICICRTTRFGWGHITIVADPSSLVCSCWCSFLLVGFHPLQLLKPLFEVFWGKFIFKFVFFNALEDCTESRLLFPIS